MDVARAEFVGDALPVLPQHVHSTSCLPASRHGSTLRRGYATNRTRPRCATIPPQQRGVVLPVPIRAGIIAIDRVERLMAHNSSIGRDVRVDSEYANRKAVA